MPSYELPLILKKMAKPETAKALKRIATKILDNNGILLSIDNLGTKSLPYRISSHGVVNREGSYFVFNFDSPPEATYIINDELKRDVDVIRKTFFKHWPKLNYDCNLEKELLPPPYRKDVQEMLEEGKKETKNKFDFNTKLDYNPFRT